MIRIGIIGTGGMANGHATRFNQQRGAKVTACCDIDRKKAKAFAERHDIPAVYTDVDAMLDEEELDGVSIVTPDSSHYQITMAVLKRKLHVMCEKPLALTPKHAWEMARKADKAGVINMTNFTHRYPALHKARELVEQGKIGEIRHVEACYLQGWLCLKKPWGTWKDRPALVWRLSTDAGSNGVLGDVGCHILDFATFVCGQVSSLQCNLATYQKDVRGNTYKGYTLDANDSTTINCRFANDALGMIHTTRWAAGHGNTLRLNVYGTDGGIELDSSIARDKLRVSYNVNPIEGKWRTVSCRKVPDNYERFVKGIRKGEQQSPSFEEGARVQSYLQACFDSDASGKVVKC